MNTDKISNSAMALGELVLRRRKYRGRNIRSQWAFGSGRTWAALLSTALFEVGE